MDLFMAKRIARVTLVAISLLAVPCLLFREGLAAFNIALGGLVGLGSVQAVAWAVRKFFGRVMGQVIIMGLSFIKVLLIFLVLVLLALYGLVKPLFFTIGFTLVPAIVIYEGFLASRRAVEQ